MLCSLKVSSFSTADIVLFTIKRKVHPDIRFLFFKQLRPNFNAIKMIYSGAPVNFMERIFLPIVLKKINPNQNNFLITEP